jgi:hypothetical protein
MTLQASYWPNKKWASVDATGSAVSLSTWSGFRSTVRDPFGELLLVKASDVTTAVLGDGLLRCLAASRVLDTDEARDELNDLQNLKRNYEKWVADLMEFTGIKTRRTLFREMHSCSATLTDGTITIEAKRHEKLEAWSALADREANRVRIAANEPPAAIGAAVIEALKRCWPLYPWQRELPDTARNEGVPHAS